MAITNSNLLAFEGAVGFGAETQGGRGGEVVKVTNLNDSGVGSLRWALEVLDQPRIVIFEVGGIINLKDEIQINGDVTVAGQTAPGGITVAGARLRVVESEVIIRGVHVRPGDSPDGDKPDDRDGISVGHSGATIKNVVIDSNSISWSLDEALSSWGDNSNITFSNNIIAEALNDSIHSKGEHSMALLVGDGSSNVSIVGNLLAHNKFRNATIKDDAKQIEFINNVVYNWGNSGYASNEGSTGHVINNVFIAGADSTGREAIRFESGSASTAYYASGNIGEIGGSAVSKLQSKYVFNPATKTVINTADVLDYVLSNAGASAGGLDAIDVRIIKSVLNGTGKIIDSQDQVGGYLTTKAQSALLDTDKDGIPDQYERLIGSNVTSADAQKDADGDGYANIENYINGLLDGFNGQTTAPKPTDQAPTPVTVDVPKPEAILVGSDISGPVATTTGPDKTITVQAEALILTQGFKTEKIGAASGDKVIKGSTDEVNEAGMTFKGAAGIYDLAIDYFDEADGVSALLVTVNGKQVANWKWDQKLGSNNANDLTASTKVISGLKLAAGDEIRLTGVVNNGEALRIDKLTFDNVANTVTPAPSKTTVPALGEYISLEAESFDLTGFVTESLKAAKNDVIIRRDGTGQHRADADFSGKSGTYDVRVNYFDENDGISKLSLLVNGKIVESWKWDEELGSANANSKTATSHVIRDLSISAGDKVSLIGDDFGGGEALRIDSLEFIPDNLSSAIGV